MGILDIFRRKKPSYIPVVKSILRKFIESEGLDEDRLGLHDVRIRDTKKCLYIDLHLTHPAPLIGRRGVRIISLASIISKALNRNCNVNAHQYNFYEEI